MCLCGHHPLTPCIIWLSRPVNRTMVTHFNGYSLDPVTGDTCLYWISDILCSKMKRRKQNVTLRKLTGLGNDFEWGWTLCRAFGVDSLRARRCLKGNYQGVDFSHFCTNMCHSILWNSSNPSRTFSGSDTFPFKLDLFFLSALKQAPMNALHFLRKPPRTIQLLTYNSYYKSAGALIFAFFFY